MDPILLVVLVLVILALVGAFPRWPYSAGWGYGPLYVLVVVLIVLLIFLALGHKVVIR